LPTLFLGKEKEKGEKGALPFSSGKGDSREDRTRPPPRPLVQRRKKGKSLPRPPTGAKEKGSNSTERKKKIATGLDHFLGPVGRGKGQTSSVTQPDRSRGKGGSRSSNAVTKMTFLRRVKKELPFRPGKEKRERLLHSSTFFQEKEENIRPTPETAKETGVGGNAQACVMFSRRTVGKGEKEKREATTTSLRLDRSHLR